MNPVATDLNVLRHHYEQYAIQAANSVRWALEQDPTLLDRWPFIADDVQKFADARAAYLGSGVER